MMSATAETTSQGVEPIAFMTVTSTSNSDSGLPLAVGPFGLRVVRHAILDPSIR